MVLQVSVGSHPRKWKDAWAGPRRARKGLFMKKAKKPAVGLRPEYKRSDFDALVRGKYVDRPQESSNVVVLDPEVARMFPNGASVNDALRALAQIAKSRRSGRRRGR